MLTEKPFNQADTEIVEKGQRRFRRFVNIAIPIFLAVEFLVIYLATYKTPGAFWIMIIIFPLMTLIILFIFLKLLKTYKKELAEQIKLKGELRVTSKTTYKQVKWLHFDSGELKNISVRKGIYDKINVDDILQIEISKYSKIILHLSRNGENLLAPAMG